MTDHRISDRLSAHLLSCRNFKADLPFPFFRVRKLSFTQEILHWILLLLLSNSFLLFRMRRHPDKQVKSFFFSEAKGLKLGRYFSRLYHLSPLCNQPRGCHWDPCCYDNIDKWVGFQRRWLEQHILQLFWQTIDGKGSSKRKKNDWVLRVLRASCLGCFQSSLTCGNMNRDDHLVHCQRPDVQIVQRHHAINCEDELFNTVVAQALWNTWDRKSRALVLLTWTRLLWRLTRLQSSPERQLTISPFFAFVLQMFKNPTLSKGLSPISTPQTKDSQIY